MVQQINEKYSLYDILKALAQAVVDKDIEGGVRAEFNGVDINYTDLARISLMLCGKAEKAGVTPTDKGYVFDRINSTDVSVGFDLAALK
jgi:hypothetical protein